MKGTRARIEAVTATLEGYARRGVFRGFLIHLVHEIFLTFLLDGRYYEYLVENFDLDPDRF